jgi:hypothetical protein
MDFPAAPVLDQEFTDAASGKSWKYDGTAWKIKPEDATAPPTPVDAYTKVESDTKFVDAAGDTMTGPLKLQTHIQFAKTDGSLDTFHLATDYPTGDLILNKTGIDYSVRVQYYDRVWNFARHPLVAGVPVILQPADDSGYALGMRRGAWSRLLPADIGRATTLAAGVTYGVKDDEWTEISTAGDFVKKTGDQMSGGLGFGSVAGTNPQDQSKHLSLYGTTFGFSITSGTMNYNASTKHDFWSGAVNTLSVQSGAIFLNKNTTISATTTFGGQLNVGDQRISFPNGYYIQCSAGGSSVGNRALVINAGTTNLPEVALKVKDILRLVAWDGGVTIYGAWSDSLAADSGVPTINGSGEHANERGTDLGKTLAAMAAKIKQLDKEVAALKAQPKR